MDEKKERQAVEYLKTQINMGEPKTVLAIYRQVIEQDVFHTSTGYAFLQELKDYLYANPNIPNNSIPDFEPEASKQVKKPDRDPVTNQSREKQSEKKQSDQKKPDKVKANRRKTAINQDKKSVLQGTNTSILFFSLFLNIVFIVMILIMFAMTLTSDSPNIINYKNKLENEYAKWEEDLKRREQELKEREAELGRPMQPLDPQNGGQSDTQEAAPLDDASVQQGQYIDEEYEITQ